MRKGPPERKSPDRTSPLRHGMKWPDRPWLREARAFMREQLVAVVGWSDLRISLSSHQYDGYDEFGNRQVAPHPALCEIESRAEGGAWND